MHVQDGPEALGILRYNIELELDPVVVYLVPASASPRWCVQVRLRPPSLYNVGVRT